MAVSPRPECVSGHLFEKFDGYRGVLKARERPPKGTRSSFLKALRSQIAFSFGTFAFEDFRVEICIEKIARHLQNPHPLLEKSTSTSQSNQNPVKFI